MLLFLVKENNIEVEGTIRPIFHSSQPINLQIFCQLEIKKL